MTLPINNTIMLASFLVQNIIKYLLGLREKPFQSSVHTKVHNNFSFTEVQVNVISSFAPLAVWVYHACGVTLLERGCLTSRIRAVSTAINIESRRYEVICWCLMPDGLSACSERLRSTVCQLLVSRKRKLDPLWMFTWRFSISLCFSTIHPKWKCHGAKRTLSETPVLHVAVIATNKPRSGYDPSRRAAAELQSGNSTVGVKWSSKLESSETCATLEAKSSST